MSYGPGHVCFILTLILWRRDCSHLPSTDGDTKTLRPYILPRISWLVRSTLFPEYSLLALTRHIVYFNNLHQWQLFRPCFPPTSIWWYRVVTVILGRCYWLWRIETRKAQPTGKPPQQRIIHPKTLTACRVRCPSLLQSPLKLEELYLATSPALDCFIIIQYDPSLIP